MTLQFSFETLKYSTWKYLNLNQSAVSCNLMFCGILCGFVQGRGGGGGSGQCHGCQNVEMIAMHIFATLFAIDYSFDTDMLVFRLYVVLNTVGLHWHTISASIHRHQL